ncbi:hypothetical protein [Nocardia sp. NPDC052566]|uniref:hypothetical protein n=1 Tax=Nocardia sp. NPDC052566 TaxID=3364330 RepID=UPI0037C8A6D0
MTQPGTGGPESVTDGQVVLLAEAMDYWLSEYSSRALEFGWFMPIRWNDGSVVVGRYGEVGYSIAAVPGGYTVTESVPREGDRQPSFYSRYEDAVKAVVFIVGTMFRDRTGMAPLLNWYNEVADGVRREPIDSDSARYVLERDPDAYYVGGIGPGVRLSRILTMTITQFNDAIRDDPGRRPNG